MRFRLRVAVAALVLGTAPTVAAQSRLNVDVVAAAAGARTSEGPTIAIQNVFADERTRELLASGFPARLTLTVELWASRTLFDELLGGVTSQRVVRYDPLSRTYRVGRVVEDSVVDEARFASLDDARRALTAPARVALPAPPSRRRVYYTASVTLETFSSNDLDEVRRWLSGDVQPALQGKRNPGSALTRGIKTLFSRLLGGDVKRVVGRSEVFDT